MVNHLTSLIKNAIILSFGFSSSFIMVCIMSFDWSFLSSRHVATIPELLHHRNLITPLVVPFPLIITGHALIVTSR